MDSINIYFTFLSKNAQAMNEGVLSESLGRVSTSPSGSQVEFSIVNDSMLQEGAPEPLQNAVPISQAPEPVKRTALKVNWSLCGKLFGCGILPGVGYLLYVGIRKISDAWHNRSQQVVDVVVPPQPSFQEKLLSLEAKKTGLQAEMKEHLMFLLKAPPMPDLEKPTTGMEDIRQEIKIRTARCDAIPAEMAKIDNDFDQLVCEQQAEQLKELDSLQADQVICNRAVNEQQRMITVVTPSDVVPYRASIPPLLQTRFDNFVRVSRKLGAIEDCIDQLSLELEQNSTTYPVLKIAENDLPQHRASAYERHAAVYEAQKKLLEKAEIIKQDKADRQSEIKPHREFIRIFRLMKPQQRIDHGYYTHRIFNERSDALEKIPEQLVEADTQLKTIADKLVELVGVSD